jgi:Na+-driven multidrug efflux pump
LRSLLLLFVDTTHSAAAAAGWVYMFPQSVATATCTRVSNALGSGDAEAARSYFRTALVMVFLQQSVLASLILSFSPNLVSFFCTGIVLMR